MGMYFQDDFWEAAQDLTVKQRSEFFYAIVTYYFAGEEPNLTGPAAACFKLCRSRLDISKQKSNNARQPRSKTEANTEQNESKTEANTEQNESKTEANTEQNKSKTEANTEQNESKPIKKESESKKDLMVSPNGETGRAGARRRATTGELQEIVGYLNAKTGSRYKPDTAATKRHINARIAEGFTVDDFKAVIDFKTDQWLGVTASDDGRDMGEYLRPSTLFGTSFESYLNAAITSPSGKPDAWSEEDRKEAQRWLEANN